MTTTASPALTFDSIGYSLPSTRFRAVEDPPPAKPSRTGITKDRAKKKRFSPPSSPPPPPPPPMEEAHEQDPVSAQVCPRRLYSPEDEAIRGLALVVSPHMLRDSESSDDDTRETDTRLSSPEFQQERVSVHTLNTEYESSPVEGGEDLHSSDSQCSSPLSPSPQSFTCSTSEVGQLCRTTAVDNLSHDDCNISDASNTHPMQFTNVSQYDSNTDNVLSFSAPVNSNFTHRPLSRQNRQAVHQNGHSESLSAPLDFGSNHYPNRAGSRPQPESNHSDSPHQDDSLRANDRGLALISPESDQPLFIGETRPVLPPKTLCLREESPPAQSLYPSKQGRISPQHSTQRHHHSRALHSTVSNPEIYPSRQRALTSSFLKCKAGEDRGQYRADYLGSKNVDSFINSVNSVAKQLIDQRPVEVIAYVSSERIRLAPPKNQSLLFKSFAIKDVLSVEKCSKNKRIIGIVIWRSKTTTPTCHVLRCPDNMISNSLYDALSFQTQLVDDISLNKVRELDVSASEHRCDH